MRFVIQIVKHGGMVGEDRSEILPEGQAVRVGHGMLADVLAPLVAIRPVQIEDDVTGVGGAVGGDLPHQLAIGLTADRSAPAP